MDTAPDQLTYLVRRAARFYRALSQCPCSLSDPRLWECINHYTYTCKKSYASNFWADLAQTQPFTHPARPHGWRGYVYDTYEISRNTAEDLFWWLISPKTIAWATVGLAVWVTYKSWSS